MGSIGGMHLLLSGRRQNLIDIETGELIDRERWCVGPDAVNGSSERRATWSKWSPCRCESSTASSSGSWSISSAGSVSRRDLSP